MFTSSFFIFTTSESHRWCLHIQFRVSLLYLSLKDCLILVDLGKSYFMAYGICFTWMVCARYQWVR